MRLAVVGPLSPARTGVATFNENLAPFMAEYCDITLFTDRSLSIVSSIGNLPVSDIDDFVADPSAFDASLYHMGNHYLFHRRTFEAMVKSPGIALLHDCVLNQFFAKYALERGNFPIFKRMLQLCYPDMNEHDVTMFLDSNGNPYDYPLGGVGALCSRGTITMNEYGRGIILKEAPGANVLKAGHPFFIIQPEPPKKPSLRQRLGISKETFIVAAIGEMTATKRLDVALEAFRQMTMEHPDSTFLLAGKTPAGFPLDDMIAQTALKNVKRFGYLDRADFNELMDIADVCVNLRFPSNGEMSGTLIEMLGRGKVVAVSNYAQFAEFPDEMCVKISHGPTETEDLSRELLHLAQDKDHRYSLGEAAKEYIAENHSPEAVAKIVVEYIKRRSDADPLLSRDQLDDLLVPDALPSRLIHILTYNTRRALNRFREQGTIRTARQTLKRAFDKAK